MAWYLYNFCYLSHKALLEVIEECYCIITIFEESKVVICFMVEFCCNFGWNCEGKMIFGDIIG